MNFCTGCLMECAMRGDRTWWERDRTGNVKTKGVGMKKAALCMSSFQDFLVSLNVANCPSLKFTSM